MICAVRKALILLKEGNSVLCRVCWRYMAGSEPKLLLDLM